VEHLFIKTLRITDIDSNENIDLLQNDRNFETFTKNHQILLNSNLKMFFVQLRFPEYIDTEIGIQKVKFKSSLCTHISPS